MIEVSQISKTFESGKKPVVDRVSFEVRPGKIACLIGPSGCGKSTTLKMINRLIEPDSGDIRVMGESFKGAPVQQWRLKFGYVVQKGGLLPHLTVAENISIMARVLKSERKRIRARVNELLELIDLPRNEFGHRYPKELSGGQQQRVGIARALMLDPQVLLMDEPFSALDPVTTRGLYQELIRINSELKKTILLVTHDMNEAAVLGDHVILLNQGRVEQQGHPAEVLEKPVSDFAMNFVKGTYK